MNPLTLQVGVILDANATAALVELLASAIERGAARYGQTSATTGKTRGMLGGPLDLRDEELLVGSRTTRKLLGVSDRKLWQMWKSGEMPAPIKIGRLVRWNQAELRAWIDAGCPAQEKWKWPRTAVN